jgi:uncharacterized membrane protein YhhN
LINAWLLVALGAMIVDWLAIWRGWQQVNYATKPAAIFFLLIWAWSLSRLSGNLLWFGVGLFFSLLGDIFLLLTYRFFIYGLIAFLLTHIAYIIAFNPTPPKISAEAIELAAVLFCIWLYIYSALHKGMVKKSAFRKMVIPVVIYSAVITVMLFSALLCITNPEWQPLYASMAVCGAGLFYCSDAMLASDRFLQPRSNARLWVRITYHLGQLAIITGALLNHLR